MPDRKKIVHLIGALGQFDASYKLRELARAQAATGADVAIVPFSASKAARRFIEAENVKCQVVRKRWNYDPFAGRQLAQMLQELQPSTVFLWGRRATDAALIARRALPNVRVIATLVKVPQLANPWWPNKSLDVVDALVVEREATRVQFVDAGQGEQKVQVIPPGVATPTAQTCSRRELLLHLGLNTESRIIALAGPLERWQMADEAIWAFELIRILHDHAALVIVGEGPELARLERFTRQVTEPNVVRFVTKVELLNDVLAHAEIYWQPGASEAIPTTLLTAMSHGLPVVASDVPPHRAVLQSEVDGFLVPAAKRAVWARHTDQLMKNTELRTKFGESARQLVTEKFSIAAMINAYDQLDLAGRPRRPGPGERGSPANITLR
jgi:glycosyltransferase involved in cell wall biosynthesis